MPVRSCFPSRLQRKRSLLVEQDHRLNDGPCFGVPNGLIDLFERVKGDQLVERKAALGEEIDERRYEHVGMGVTFDYAAN